MPELPEVEYYRKYILQHCKGKKLLGIEALDDRVARPSRAVYKHFGVGKTIRSITRKGKYLFWDLGPGAALMMHFGMTGRPEICPCGRLCNFHINPF